MAGTKPGWAENHNLKKQLDFTFELEDKSISASFFNPSSSISSIRLDTPELQFISAKRHRFGQWLFRLALLCSIPLWLSYHNAAIPKINTASPKIEQAPQEVQKTIPLAAIPLQITPLETNHDLTISDYTPIFDVDPAPKNRFLKPVIIETEKTIIAEIQPVIVPSSSLSVSPLKLAQTKAAQSSKLIFVKFGASWCLPCEMMDEFVFSSKEVQATLNSKYHFVNIDIDDEHGTLLKQQYRISQLPTLMITDATGLVLERHEGTMSTSLLLDLLHNHESIVEVKSASQESLPYGITAR